MSTRLLDPVTLEPVDLDAAELHRIGVNPTPYTRELLTRVRDQRARLAAHALEP